MTSQSNQNPGRESSILVIHSTRVGLQTKVLCLSSTITWDAAAAAQDIPLAPGDQVTIAAYGCNELMGHAYQRRQRRDFVEGYMTGMDRQLSDILSRKENGPLRNQYLLGAQTSLSKRHRPSWKLVAPLAVS